jgi:hypothetical protein
MGTEYSYPPVWAFVVRTAPVFVVHGPVIVGAWSNCSSEVLEVWERLKPRSKWLGKIGPIQSPLASERAGSGDGDAQRGVVTGQIGLAGGLPNN